MSLATRCTSCNTVFRVVQDQLKVSEGWVRCGRCHEVFNALESLFDLEPAAAAVDAVPAPESKGTAAAELQVVEPKEDGSPTPDAAPEPSPPAAPPSPAAAANDAASAAGAVLPAEPAARPETAARASPPAPAPAALPAWPPPAFDATTRAGFGNAETSPASRLDTRDRNDFEDARFNSALFADEGGAPTADAADPFVDGVSPAEPDEGAVRPEFLRRAEQRARWDRPAVAVALATACGVLLLGLAGQVAHHFRDLVAATYPQTRPALLALCEVAGCRIEPLRRIEDIVIESSALTGAPSGDAIRLSVVLRNRGPLPLALPAIELSLTDPGGQLLARRALLPADFAMTGTTLAANAETPLQLVLAVDGRRPSGYTVEPFYP
ncbi:MAG TPA: zinc-ribbon and DUF3426 domain-containing protein [Burkholderiaceae bacterium]|nr:zinc-ribbon and DUF3426 domain-containing protein [Burkholderiaceae bacterium]